MPSVGVSGEFFKDNQQFGEPFDTGGARLLNAGAEIYYANLALGFSYSRPGKQELFSGKVEASDRFTTHLTMMF